VKIPRLGGLHYRYERLPAWCDAGGRILANDTAVPEPRRAIARGQTLRSIGR